MKLTVRESIAAPVDEVFAAASDFANAAELIGSIKRIEMLTEGEVGVGTRFRETRVMYGREASEEMEVLEFEPDTGYVLGCESHGCRYRTAFNFISTDAGTEVEMQFEATPLTWFAKIMSVLTRPAIRGVAGMLEQDLEDLKKALEGE